MYNTTMYKDSLYRVSFKCLILDRDSRVLVVKERGRSSWDIPGGGIEHGETIEESIARELLEEVCFQGDFKYQIIKIHNPVKLLTRDVWQIKVVILLEADNLNFSVGNEADEIMYIDPAELRDSDQESESRIFEYVRLALNL